VPGPGLPDVHSAWSFVPGTLPPTGVVALLIDILRAEVSPSGRDRSRREPSRAAGERGESLAELIVAIAILGIAVVTIVSAMGAGILLSDRHRQQTTAGTVLDSAAEWEKSQPYDTNCPASYTVPTPPAKTGFPVAVTVTYLDDSGATVSCSSDTALQAVALNVTSPSGFVSSVTVVKRNSA
jgi:type II secretory pathway pseudopilin PulG